MSDRIQARGHAGCVTGNCDRRRRRAREYMAMSVRDTSPVFEPRVLPLYNSLSMEPWRMVRVCGCAVCAPHNLLIGCCAHTVFTYNYCCNTPVRCVPLSLLPMMNTTAVNITSEPCGRAGPRSKALRPSSTVLPAARPRLPRCARLDRGAKFAICWVSRLVICLSLLYRIYHVIKGGGS